MLHHRRLPPPGQDYPPNVWSVIEKSFREEFIAQMETVMSLGNGYIGMCESPEEGGPCVQNGTFINGFYESWPISHGEEVFGFARTGQTMLNVTLSGLCRGHCWP
jgi:alpha,alpha-trehalose phosphorylase